MREHGTDFRFFFSSHLIPSFLFCIFQHSRAVYLCYALPFFCAVLCDTRISIRWRIVTIFFVWSILPCCTDHFLNSTFAFIGSFHLCIELIFLHDIFVFDETDNASRNINKIWCFTVPFNLHVNWHSRPKYCRLQSELWAFFGSGNDFPRSPFN